MSLIVCVCWFLVIEKNSSLGSCGVIARFLPGVHFPNSGRTLPLMHVAGPRQPYFVLSLSRGGALGLLEQTQDCFFPVSHTSKQKITRVFI